MKNGQREPLFDWKLAPIVHKQVRSLEMIMYSAHVAVAIYQLTILYRHDVCFKGDGLESGELNYDGERLLVLAIIQLGFVAVFGLLKFCLSSMEELITQRH